MSSFKESLKKAIQETEEKRKKEEAANPNKVPKQPVSGRTYLIRSYGFLLVVFLGLVFLSNQSILNTDYGMTTGTYDGDDLSYTVDGQEIVHQDARSYGYRYTSNNRTKSSGGDRFFFQVINYKKDNPREYVLSLAIGGTIAEPGSARFHNCLLLLIILLGILNFYLYRWATGDKAKRMMEEIAQESDQADQTNDTRE